MSHPQILLLTALAVTSPVFADEDLGEAVPLEAAAGSSSAESRGAPAESREWQARGYGLARANWAKMPPWNQVARSIPDFEASAVATWKPHPNLTLFGDGRATYVESAKKSDKFLDQAGVRFRPHDNVTLAVGKERNRRAPGLFISPSDFLHSRQALPGLEEDRSGIKLVRASYQSENITSDALLLEDNDYAARTFLRVKGVDLALDVGRVESKNRLGASVQKIFANAWRAYAETGEADGSAPSHLFGGGYEGFEKSMLRVEYYRNGQSSTTTAVPALLSDRDYAIASGSTTMDDDLVTMTQTFIRSLDHDLLAAVSRVECVASDRHVFGATWIRLDEKTWQGSIDWKVSF